MSEMRSEEDLSPAEQMANLINERIHIPEVTFYEKFAELLLLRPDFEPRIEVVRALKPHIGDWTVLDGEDNNPTGITLVRSVEPEVLDITQSRYRTGHKGMFYREDGIDIRTHKITNATIATLCLIEADLYKANVRAEKQTITAVLLAKSIERNRPTPPRVSLQRKQPKRPRYPKHLKGEATHVVLQMLIAGYRPKHLPRSIEIPTTIHTTSSQPMSHPENLEPLPLPEVPAPKEQPKPKPQKPKTRLPKKKSKPKVEKEKIDKPTDTYNPRLTLRSEQIITEKPESPTRFRTLTTSHLTPWEKSTHRNRKVKEPKLSSREIQVLEILYLQNKEISAKLGCSQNDIRNYIGHATRKLSAANNHELLVVGLAKKLIDARLIPDFDPSVLNEREKQVVIDCWDKTTSETQSIVGIGRTMVRKAIAEAHKKAGVVERRQLNLILIKAGVVPPAAQEPAGSREW